MYAFGSKEITYILKLLEKKPQNSTQTYCYGPNGLQHKSEWFQKSEKVQSSRNSQTKPRQKEKTVSFLQWEKKVHEGHAGQFLCGFHKMHPIKLITQWTNTTKETKEYRRCGPKRIFPTAAKSTTVWVKLEENCYNFMQQSFQVDTCLAPMIGHLWWICPIRTHHQAALWLIDNN